MVKRKCKICEHTKNISSFANAGVVNGKQYYRYFYKTCYIKFKNIRKEKNKEKYYELKKKNKCAICGEDDYRVLDFDHIKGKKSFNLSDAVRKGYSLEKIIKEIDKCQVLCANCHRRKTWEEQKRSVG